MTVRLYMASSTEDARRVIDCGFVGVPWWPIKTDETGQPVRDERGRPTYTGERLERCEFRDQPPSGLAFSRTTESRVYFDPDDHTAKVVSKRGQDGHFGHHRSKAPERRFPGQRGCERGESNSHALAGTGS
jgi:hypothetical protein